MLQDQETVIVVVVIYRPSIYPSKYFLQNLQTVLTRECYTKLQKKYNHGWCYWKFVGFIIAKNLREKSGFHQLAYPRKKTLIDQAYPQFHLKTFKFLPLCQYIPVTMNSSPYKIHNATNKTQNDNTKAFWQRMSRYYVQRDTQMTPSVETFHTICFFKTFLSIGIV